MPTSLASFVERDATRVAKELGVEPDNAAEMALVRSGLRDALDDLRRRIDDTRQKEANDRRFGPFYSSIKAMEVMGLRDRQSLTNRIRRNTILRVRTADGRNAFPAFQFDDGTVIDRLRPVLQVLLPAAATPWTVLDWLVDPAPDLDDRSPIDAIRAGDPTVLALARQDAAAWQA